jgi:hypothetical protein
MTGLRHHFLEMQTARRQAAEQLRKVGTTVKASATIVQMAAVIAERTGWRYAAALQARRPVPDALRPGHA